MLERSHRFLGITSTFGEFEKRVLLKPVIEVKNIINQTASDVYFSCIFGVLLASIGI